MLVWRGDLHIVPPWRINSTLFQMSFKLNWENSWFALCIWISKHVLKGLILILKVTPNTSAWIEEDQYFWIFMLASNTQTFAFGLHMRAISACYLNFILYGSYLRLSENMCSLCPSLQWYWRTSSGCVALPKTLCVCCFRLVYRSELSSDFKCILKFGLGSC